MPSGPGSAADQNPDGTSTELRITTSSALNRDIEEWPPLFGDLLLASAALDRLLHHAHVIEMEGDTFRNPPAAKRAKNSGSRST
jgi:IstB-like ATP binding protein